MKPAEYKAHESLNRLIGKIYDGISKLAISDHVARLFPRGKISFRRGTFRRNRSYKLCAPRAVIRIQSREKETEEHVDAFTLPAFPSTRREIEIQFQRDELSFRNGIVLKYKIQDTNLTLFFNPSLQLATIAKGTCYKGK